MAQARNGCGYLSQNDPRLHIGLGNAARVDSLVVTWPSGRVQRLTEVEANQILHLTEPYN